MPLLAFRVLTKSPPKVPVLSLMVPPSLAAMVPELLHAVVAELKSSVPLPEAVMLPVPVLVRLAVLRVILFPELAVIVPLLLTEPQVSIDRSPASASIAWLINPPPAPGPVIRPAVPLKVIPLPNVRLVPDFWMLLEPLPNVTVDEPVPRSS